VNEEALAHWGGGAVALKKTHYIILHSYSAHLESSPTYLLRIYFMSTSNSCGPGSVAGIATGYGLDGCGDRIPVRATFSALVQTGPGAHSVSCTMGIGSFPGVKSGQGVTLRPYFLLVPWSRKCRAIPLLPLWAAQPVQSLSACTKVHFTF